jgi:ribosomal protein S12 methylthiotransferase accessory factor
MSHRLRFKACHHLEILPPHGVLLLSERGQFFLRGRAYLLVAPFLNGQHTEGDIAARLAGQLQEAEVLYALELLKQKGYVVEDPGDGAPDSQAAYWELCGEAPAAVAHKKESAAVAVRALGSASAAPFQAMLEELGVRVSDDGDIGVVLTDDYLQRGLPELNREALSRRRPWLLVRPSGADVWLGPLFVPFETGCHACLAHFLKGHRKAETYVEKKRGMEGPLVVARAALPSTSRAALSLAATFVARWLLTGDGRSLLGRVVVLDPATLERTEHTLLRRPQCPACGDPEMVARGQRAPVALAACEPSFTEEGGYRRSPPEAMLARHAHLVSPITGIVSHLRRLLDRTGSDLTVSYAADHNFAHVDEDLFFLREGQRSHSGGKGKTDAQARASALGESIERYSGLYQGDEACVTARMKDLGPAAIHPNACMLFSERQIAERDRWNQSSLPFTRVPAAFDPSQEIEWAPLFPLHDARRSPPPAEPRYLPMACCYYGYGLRRPSPYAFADSNGCAAGATREEAVFQGLLELVERDATAVWWYNRVRRPGVDLASFGDPYYAELAAYYRTIHRTFWALDLTHDLGVPTFAALSRRTDKPVEDIIFGLGAHTDPKVALLRAVTELNQFLPSVIHVTESSPKYNWYEAGVRFFKTATLDTDPHLAPDPAAPPRTLADFPRGPTRDILDGIFHCVEKLEQRGLQPLLLDQTRPETGLSVVRVVVPGLRHFWARFAPGRLYDVPVALGWLPRPLREEELNPVPIFF